jgi:hypothetical protein
MEIGPRKYLLTALSAKSVPDLICCTDSLDYQFITDHLRLKGISFQIVPETDAVRLLNAGKCIAFGCYLLSDDPKKDQQAAFRAKAMYLGLSSEVGVIRAKEAVGLSIQLIKQKA